MSAESLLPLTPLILLPKIWSLESSGLRKLKEIEYARQGRNNATFQGSEPLASFVRFRQLLLGEEGEVKFSLSFSMDEQCRTVITGNASTSVNLECQVCLEELLVEVSCEINTVVLDGLEELFDLNQERAALVATGKTVSLQDILEDDLMIALPMVPRHLNGCSQHDPIFVENIESGEDSGLASHDETHRPFSDLALKFKKQQDMKEV
ncbi:MAG: hypothetical protein CMQ39_04175 [Gammaproteobacteria bacterium]|nr:hypothetical protein [Gammaproteobacteria bacterium]